MSLQMDIPQDNLGKYIKLSLIFHASIFFIFGVQVLFFTDTPIQFEKAIRVDMVGLPDKIEPLPQATAPTPVPATRPEPPAATRETAPPKTENVQMPTKPTEVDPEAVHLEKRKQKQKSAFEKLKQMEALEKIQKQMEAEQAQLAAQQAAQAARKKYKGNVLSPGSELTGVNKLQAETYVSDVHQHMMKNWMLPEYLKGKGLRSEVLVRFDESGVILEKQLVRGSGSATFDDFVLAAIERSSPVPAPPSQFSKIASVQGFLFRFSHDK